MGLNQKVEAEGPPGTPLRTLPPGRRCWSFLLPSNVRKKHTGGCMRCRPRPKAGRRWCCCYARGEDSLLTAELLAWCLWVVGGKEALFRPSLKGRGGQVKARGPRGREVAFLRLCAPGQEGWPFAPSWPRQCQQQLPLWRARQGRNFRGNPEGLLGLGSGLM